MIPLYVKLDPGARRIGNLILGGSPYVVLRLSAKASSRVDSWLAGEPVTADDLKLADLLVRKGILHPRREITSLTAQDVTVVVPVRDHADDLARLLPALSEVAKVLVVDDGSTKPIPEAIVRHSSAKGPAAARNAGWRLAGTELVAFLDADVVPEPGWLATILPHFEDPGVVAVAPRVRSVPGPSMLERYEELRSPLDLGDAEAPVRPGSRVGYVPSAALVVRFSALVDHNGFDEEMRFGEDVDLVWRFHEAGAQVRYEPRATVRHRPRETWNAWLRQRFGYGTSAAPLAIRHGRKVAPVKVSLWSALAWALVAAGRPLLGGAVAGTTASLLPRKLKDVGVPATESVQLAVRGHVGAGRLLGDAVVRSWWPVAIPVLASTRWGRWVLLAAFARHVEEWYSRGANVGLPGWLAARVADDLAYGAGVWWGAVRHGTVKPLLPDLSDWPGRDGVGRT
ncbi:mycofactocin biosynthesis glycosyltransferase MftF [Kutzneria kofuensis]|uniref:Mycofactocin system glycosyltransferase n=1 Tax=Kutzneria kofuensis TaxID=103725 RepID=A0A7W9KM65_9PSEU|nr:mycofactocin biosynthesis glycosyltransferase MftF [Kutzneria kofuensis]MBB5895123.1 mycofactocin system glycosyltransferase [Kutzneria kofuensis]